LLSLLGEGMLVMKTHIQYGNRSKPGRERPIKEAGALGADRDEQIPAQGSTPVS